MIPNLKVYDDEGVLRNEYYLVIRGPVGTTSFSWLIECRNRPKSGPEPIGWIEQLIGRKADSDFDKVTAVSTTGFSSAAEVKAQRGGIELRTVHSISAENIEDWWRTSFLDLRGHIGVLRHAHMDTKEQLPQELKDAINLELSDIQSNTPVLVSKIDGVAVSLNDAWDRVLNQNPRLFAGLEAGEDAVIKNVAVRFPDENDRYMLVTNSGTEEVTQITFTAELPVVVRRVPISSITEYQGIGATEPIAQTVQFEFELGDHEHAIRIHRLGDDTVVKWTTDKPGAEG